MIKKKPLNPKIQRFGDKKRFYLSGSGGERANDGGGDDRRGGDGARADTPDKSYLNMRAGKMQ